MLLTEINKHTSGTQRTQIDLRRREFAFRWLAGWLYGVLFVSLIVLVHTFPSQSREGSFIIQLVKIRDECVGLARCSTYVATQSQLCITHRDVQVLVWHLPREGNIWPEGCTCLHLFFSLDLHGSFGASCARTFRGVVACSVFLPKIQAQRLLASLLASLLMESSVCSLH